MIHRGHRYAIVRCKGILKSNLIRVWDTVKKDLNASIAQREPLVPPEAE